MTVNGFSSRLILIISMLASPYAVAENNEDSGFYIGSDLHLLTTDDSDNNDNLTSTGVGLNIGYLFNRYVGVEAGYSVSDDFIEKKSFEHIDASLIGYIPLSDVFDMYIGAGVAGYDSQVLGKGKVGVSYQFNDNFSWLVGYTFYSKPDNWDSSISSFDIGFRYRFSPMTPTVQSEQESISRPVAAATESALVTTSTRNPDPVCQQVIASDEYIVQPGDWLLKIARTFDMKSTDFYQVNNGYINQLNDINIIQPGDVVKVYRVTENCSHVE